MIDGYKVLLRLRSIEHEERTIDYHLNAYCELIFDCRAQQVQFVITKWDLHTHVYSLEQVKDVLSRNKRFCNAVGQRTRPTYLIPVSAVGNHFAYFDPEKRAVVKRPEGRALPYNLDVTLAFTITDTLLSGFKEKYAVHTILKHFLKIVKLGAAGTAWVLKLSAFLPDEDALTVRALIIAEKVNHKIRDGAIRLDDAIYEKLRRIKDKNTALESVIGIQSNIIADFLSSFSYAEIISPVVISSLVL